MLLSWWLAVAGCFCRLFRLFAAPATSAPNPGFGALQMSILSRVALLAGLLVAALWQPDATAQNYTRGGSLWTTDLGPGMLCRDCHNNVTNDPEPTPNSKAGNDWHFIQQGMTGTINGMHNMSDLYSFFYNSGAITDQDLKDLCAYIAKTENKINDPATDCGGTITGGGAGTISASPNPLSFGSVNVGSNSTLTITVTISTAAVNFTAPSITGTNAADFSVSSNSCTGNKPPGSCSINIKFQPTASGARNASITIGISPGTAANVTLSGTGAA